MRRSAFTVLEVLVAVSLASMLVAVVAMLFLQASDTRRHVLDQIDARSEIRAALGQMTTDGSSAVALADLPRFFHAARVDVTRTTGDVVRTDTLEITRLGEDERLQRVRYWVEWDSAIDRGTLWRDRTPVAAADLPLEQRSLASSEPPESTVLLRNVRGFSVQIAEGAGFVDPPVDPPDDWCQDFVIEGVEGRVLHDRLWVTDPTFEGIPEHTLVYLRHDRIARPKIKEGYYPLTRVGTTDVSFGRRIGQCELVYYRAAWLPPSVSLSVDVEGETHVTRVPLTQPRLKQLYFQDGQTPLGVVDTGG